MLWSLLKMILFFGLVAAMAVGAVYLMEAGGGVRITFGGMEYNLGPFQALVALVVLMFAVWLVFKLAGLLTAVLRFLKGDETAITRYFDRNREQRGYQALADALVALASGEGREALYRAAKAERLLKKPELTNLLTAQAAELAGDRKRAEEVYRELLTNDKTRFVGVRGILRQKLAEGDTETAMKLAEKAFALKPRHGEVQDILLKLQADTADWSGARKTLAAKLSSGNLPRDVYRRRDAVLALSEARALLDKGAVAEAQEEFIEANRLSPDLVPAAVMAARAYIRQGKPRYAARVLKKAWEAQPHPELAAAFAEIVPDETPEQRLKRFQALTRIHPDHPETRMLLAELYIAAEDFPAARRALGDLPTEHPTARALTLMAAIERGEGADDAVVRGWLARAVSAPRGPQWVCGNCNTVHGSWAPVCSNCGGFDTLEWREPTEAELEMPTGAEMLPLIVGKPEDSPHAAGAEQPVAALEGEIVGDAAAPDQTADKTGDKTGDSGENSEK